MVATLLLAAPLLRAAHAGGPPTPAAPHGLHLPATFTGDLPCADCEAVRWHLDVWPDGVFHLHREWLGRSAVRDEIGTWRIEKERKALVLSRGGEMPLQVEITGPDTLRALDIDGRPIVSSLPYALKSDGTLRPADLTLNLAGEMTYMADAARFTECRTSRCYPVAMEADFVAMERGYRKTVKEPGAKLYVTFEGSILDRPKMEGDGAERTVVVTRFIKALPDEWCKGR
ncbi:MAG: copper resistance protein NlpE N-terminal domain-containing protein [Acidobacteria bacterium]|nr:copper resistance protein NlpE N-terminal domain-containing protein [Acidobacteriota bacterium]